MPYKDVLTRMIDLAFKREREVGEITYSFDTKILAGASFGGSKGSKL